MNEFWTFFQDIAPKLAHRAVGFCIIFQKLDEFDHPPVIIETGCVRRDDSWESDGSSSRLFDTYAQLRPGTKFITIDINETSTDCAKRHCKVGEVITADSVSQFTKLSNSGLKADLLYLDSFDLNTSDPLPSSRHHLKELLEALPMISKDTMVVVDDCFFDEGQVNGKGMLVSAYMHKCGAEPFLLDYQCGWTGIR